MKSHRLLSLLLAPSCLMLWSDAQEIEILGTGTESLIGGDLTDPEDDGDEFAGEEDPSWNWVSIDSTDEPGFQGGEFSYNVFDNTLGGGNAKWCCNSPSEDSPHQLTVEFDAPISLTHFTISSANDVPDRDPLAWQIQGSNDGENFEAIFVREEDEEVLWDERLQVVQITLDQPSPAYTFIRYEVTFALANHQLGELEYFGNPAGGDTDGDGLPDWFEELHELDVAANDAAEDPDSDGLTNLQEFEKNTKPKVADTDSDGLKDGVESGTGTWVTADDTGTNPLRDDTDDDNLKDGVETNTGTFVSATDTGTDPNKDDTDGDGFRDGKEVADGFNPTDKNSFPAEANIELLGTGTDSLLGSDLTDVDDDGDETVDIADENWPEEGGWDFVGLTASSKEHFSDPNVNPNPREGAFDVFDNSVGSLHNKWCCGGPPQQVTVEFADPVALTHFTITSGNDSPARDPLTFEIQGSNDGENFETIYQRDDDESIWDARNQVALITLPGQAASYRFIRYEVTSTAGGHQINEIEYFGGMGNPTPFQVTAIAFDKEKGETTLVWESRPNATYSIDYSANFEFDWIELTDGFPSEGDETTFVEEDIPPEERAERYYRVREE
jgi:hypothetical protein